MKIRVGFVTNSSSSSFLIVGTQNDDLIRRLLQAEGITQFECNHGVHFGRFVNFYGGYDDPYYAGIPIENLMNSMTLPEIKRYVANSFFKDLLVEVDENELYLYYGEVGD